MLTIRLFIKNGQTKDHSSIPDSPKREVEVIQRAHAKDA